MHSAPFVFLKCQWLRWIENVVTQAEWYKASPENSKSIQCCHCFRVNSRPQISKCKFVSSPTSLLTNEFKNSKLNKTYFIEVWITDFDEIWHECNFQKNIWPVFFFFQLAIVDVEGVKTDLKIRGYETYFVKYLGNDRRCCFCVHWWN